MTASRFLALKMFKPKTPFNFQKNGYHVTADDVVVTLWQTVVYFVYKFSLSFFESNRRLPTGFIFQQNGASAHSAQRRAAHKTGCGPAV